MAETPDPKPPKRPRRRTSETQAMRRILDDQVRRVAESPDASVERRETAQELRRITDKLLKPSPGAEPPAAPPSGS